MTVPRPGRKSGLALAATSAAVLAAVALGQSTPVAVKATAKDEVGPVAGDGWFVWSRGREREPSPFDVYAQQTGKRPFRVNKPKNQAYAGGIDGTTLVYQVIRGNLASGSDLRLFDLATRRHKTLPRGISTNTWECCGTISGDWLLFSRGRNFTSSRQLVILRNLRTGEQRVLDTLQNRGGLVSAGQLNGTFAVWERCDPYPQCQVFRYDISTASARALTVPSGKIPYAPTVNQFGTAYFFQSNRGCGKGVQLMKQRLTGPPELIASLPPRRDVDVAFAHVDSSKPPSDVVTTRIYFDRAVCGKTPGKWDIFRVDDSERAPPTP